MKATLLWMGLLALMARTNGLAATGTAAKLRARHRNELLNLLNHPLQIQLATGELPYGSFLRLCHDRDAVLEALMRAASAGARPSV